MRPYKAEPAEDGVSTGTMQPSDEAETAAAVATGEERKDELAPKHVLLARAAFLRTIGRYPTTSTIPSGELYQYDLPSD